MGSCVCVCVCIESGFLSRFWNGRGHHHVEPSHHLISLSIYYYYYIEWQAMLVGARGTKRSIHLTPCALCIVYAWLSPVERLTFVRSQHTDVRRWRCCSICCTTHTIDPTQLTAVVITINGSGGGSGGGGGGCDDNDDGGSPDYADTFILLLPCSIHVERDQRFCYHRMREGEREREQEVWLMFLTWKSITSKQKKKVPSLNSS